MTSKIQVSDKLGDLIILVSSEHEDPNIAYADFAGTLALIGNRQAEATLARIDAALSKAQPDPLAQATAVVQRAFPAAAPIVPAAAAPAAAGAAPSCQHGVKSLVTGTSKQSGQPWRAWGCSADRNDPTKCKLEFIRG